MKPESPFGRVIREGGGDFCPFCNSTRHRKFFGLFGKLICDNKKCLNVIKNMKTELTKEIMIQYFESLLGKVDILGIDVGLSYARVQPTLLDDFRTFPDICIKLSDSSDEFRKHSIKNRDIKEGDTFVIGNSTQFFDISKTEFDDLYSKIVEKKLQLKVSAQEAQAKKMVEFIESCS